MYYPDGSGWGTIIGSSSLRTSMVSAQNFVGNGYVGESGTITFSDGSKIEVHCGLITKVTKGTSVSFS